MSYDDVMISQNDVMRSTTNDDSGDELLTTRKDTELYDFAHAYMATREFFSHFQTMSVCKIKTLILSEYNCGEKLCRRFRDPQSGSL